MGNGYSGTDRISTLLAEMESIHSRYSFLDTLKPEKATQDRTWNAQSDSLHSSESQSHSQIDSSSSQQENSLFNSEHPDFHKYKYAKSFSLFYGRKLVQQMHVTL